NGTRTSLATTSAAIAGTTPILTIGAGGVYVDDFRFTSGSGASRYSGSTITVPNGAFPDR
ncbi:MAG: hypothetical protein EBR82_34755, partial [Caulobacteraceae bacterium]|nr:hypothetical protein [Caulobacteraceae bacterium]